MANKIYIEGEACNRRLLELSKIRKYFELNGYEIVSKPEKADLVFFCTCAFKEKEENYSVTRLRELIKSGAQMFVYGCLPNIAPEKYNEFSHIKNLAPKDLEKIDEFFNNTNCKFKDVPEFNFIKENNSISYKIKRNIKTNDIFTSEFYRRSFKSLHKYIQTNKTEADKEYKLLVSRGCQGKCSYCAIKFSVGPVKSKPIDKILSELKNGVEKGYRKYIILGDDPGCFGLDIGSTFPELISALINEAKNLEKQQATVQGRKSDIEFHVNEIHPKFLIRYENGILEYLHDKRVKSILCPVQSGSNRILSLMEREHSIEEFKNVINNIREFNSEIKIFTHIIVGFPSETEQDFFETLNAIKQINCDYVVVFPYHEKRHTPAAEIKGKLPEELIKSRSNEAFKFFKSQGVTAYSQCP